MTQVQTQIVKSAPNSGGIKRLPPAQNEGAAFVAGAADKICGALTAMSEADRNAFAYALVVAANESDVGKCRPMSVLLAAYNAARLGLPPGKAQGLCYFVPFKGECTLIVGFRGWIDLASRNQFLRSVQVDVVTKEEVEAGDFEHWRDETGDRLRHRPHLNRNPVKGNIVAAYAVAQLTNGGNQVKVVPIAKILKVEKDTPPWKSTFDEMACKTAIHRAAKLWRLTPQLQLAAALDDLAEAELSQGAAGGLDDVADVTPKGRGLKLGDFTQPPTTPLDEGGAGGSPDGGQEPTDAGDGQPDAETAPDEPSVWAGVQEGYFAAKPKGAKETESAALIRYERWRSAVTKGAKDQDEALARCNTALDEMSQ